MCIDSSTFDLLGHKATKYKISNVDSKCIQTTGKEFKVRAVIKLDKFYFEKFQLFHDSI